MTQAEETQPMTVVARELARLDHVAGPQAVHDLLWYELMRCDAEDHAVRKLQAVVAAAVELIKWDGFVTTSDVKSIHDDGGRAEDAWHSAMDHLIDVVAMAEDTHDGEKS